MLGISVTVSTGVSWDNWTLEQETLNVNGA